MSRPGVSYLEVSKAANQIMAGGQEPTIERIRAQLKTGSNSTIGAHLRLWREKQTPLQEIASKEKIPEELIAVLKDLWERVMSHAQEKMDTNQKLCQQALKEHQERIGQLEHSNAQLMHSEKQLEESRDSLAQKNEALEQSVAEFRTEIVTLQTKGEGQLQQLQEKQTRIEELHKQNLQTQANLEHYRTTSLEQRQLEQQRAEQYQRELNQTVQQLRIENELLRQQNIILQQQQEHLESEQSRVEGKCAELSSQLEKMSIELSQTNQMLTHKTALEEHWQNQYELLERKFEEQNGITNELKTHNVVLLQEVAIIKKLQEELKEQNKALAHDKWVLGQEKAQLMGQLDRV